MSNKCLTYFCRVLVDLLSSVSQIVQKVTLLLIISSSNLSKTGQIFVYIFLAK